ncbi:MAG: GNAT family N-acetyltransferase [Alphaproteobacteria bacterium]|nr:GNAT family N-acetyltransferase [Alphaproteobacteria bacterium]
MPFLVSIARPGTSAALTGAHVVLRPPVAADFESWSNLRHESRNFLMPWEPTWAPDELTKEAFRRRLRRYAQAARDGTGHIFFIFDKKTGALMGGCQLSNIRQGVAQSAATLGYWMGERYAGKGLMTDAVMALIRYCVTKLGLHRIEAACLPDNAASRRVLTKAGFVEEGVARKYLKINGQWRDHVLFAIIEDDVASGRMQKG